MCWFRWALWVQYIPRNMHTIFCFAVLCCGYTLTDFPISIRFTSLALWQSDDCPSASKATLMNMDKYFMYIHYERFHNHNKAKHNKTVCIFLGIYCSYTLWFWYKTYRGLFVSCGSNMNENLSSIAFRKLSQAGILLYWTMYQQIWYDFYCHIVFKLLIITHVHLVWFILSLSFFFIYLSGFWNLESLFIQRQYVHICRRIYHVLLESQTDYNWRISDQFSKPQPIHVSIMRPQTYRHVFLFLTCANY